MAILVTDSSLEDRLMAEREAIGANRFDEVWEGIYMMAPMPNDEHQYLVSRFGYILEHVIGISGLGDVRPGVNLSNRQDDWKQDYRVPDLAVFLRDGAALNLGTHWRGSADFLVEITSSKDRTREKIAFYSRLGVRELLIIERQPWSIELYRYTDGELRKKSTADADTSVSVNCSAVPLTFRLISAEPRPTIEVTHASGGQQWLV